MYSLREGRTSSNLDRHTRYSKSMETHFPRERGRAGRRKEARRFGGGHSNNDSIHSFTRPSLNLSFCLYPPLFLRTPSTFHEPTTTTMHPLSHIITRPLWKCASLQTLDVTTGRSPQAERSCRNKRGLVMAAKESHPTHNYYYPRPIHSLQMPL